MRPKDQPTGQDRTFIEEARRSQIVSAAIDTIAEKGLRRSSLSRIADHAGISKGVISYHFAGKDDLLREVVIAIYTAAAEQVGPAVQAASTAPAMLRAYITANLAFIRDKTTYMAAVREIFSDPRKENGEPLFTLQDDEAMYQPLEDVFRQGQQQGEFCDFDGRVMAVSLRAAIDRAGAQFVFNPDLDIDGYARELADLFDRATRAQ